MRYEIIKADSFTAAFDDCVERVGKRKVDLKKRTVVIVPDKYTLYAERRLFGGKGAFDVEVVTFSRLLYKTGFKPVGYISRFGAIMLLRKLIGEGGDLKCFHRSARFNGFAEKMYDTFAQIEASCVTPEALKESAGKAKGRALKVKIDDIAALMTRYENAVEGKYTDASALLKSLPAALKDSGYLDGATVYVLNFDRFTAVHRRAIKEITERAAVTYVYSVPLASEPHDLPKRPEIYSAPDFESSLEAAAARIRNALYENEKKAEENEKSGNGKKIKKLRQSDFCIATAEADFATVERVMRGYGLDFELDAKYPLMLHPSSRYLFALLDAADTRTERRKLTELAKNPLSGIDIGDAAMFENYCNRRRIDYKGFLTPFSGETRMPYTAEEAAAERVRESLVAKITLLRSKLKPRMSAAEFAEVCKSILDGADKRTVKTVDGLDLAGFESGIYDTASLMEGIMGEGEYPLELLVATLKEGISAREIAYLPRHSDCVMIGPPALFRGQRFEKVFVLNLGDGVLPIVTKDSGVITDTEIDVLGAGGATIEPKTDEVNERAESELMYLFGAGKELFISYISSDDVRPSGLLRRVEKAAEEPIRSSTALERDGARYERGKGADKLVSLLACSYSSAVRLFLSLERTAENPPYLRSLKAAIGDGADKLLYEKKDSFEIGRGDIFFPKRTAYISQIQTYFLCPYRHFLQYGLGLKEREDGSLKAQDVGIILHRIAEVYVREGDFDEPEAKARALFERVMNDDFPDFADISGDARRRLCGEAVRLCRTVSAQFKLSGYLPYGQEERFGKNAARFKTVPAVLKSGEEIDIVGVMDRVDVLGEKARVIDYKTGYVGSGKKAVASEKFYYGVKFQLQFYAAVLRRNGFDVSGLFYFPVGNNWSDEGKYCRMTGAFVGDPDSIIEMDSSIAGGGKSNIFNASLTLKKDGTLSSGRNSLALSKEELDEMCDYAEKIFESGIRDIDSGFIAPYPYFDGKSSACDFCPYAEICANKEEKTFRACV